MNQKIDKDVPEEMRAVAYLFNLSLEMQRTSSDGPAGWVKLLHPCGECQGFIYLGRPLEELVSLCQKLEVHHAGFEHRAHRELRYPYNQPFKK